MTDSRRNFITGLVGFVACAPAIVRASSLMSVKSFKPTFFGYQIGDIITFEDTELLSGSKFIPQIPKAFIVTGITRHGLIGLDQI